VEHRAVAARQDEDEGAHDLAHGLRPDLDAGEDLGNEAIVDLGLVAPAANARIARTLSLACSGWVATLRRLVRSYPATDLGPNEVWLYPSVEAEARGWAAAMSGEFRVEGRKNGRGERTGPFTIPIWGRVTRPPGYRLVREDSA